MNGSLTIANKPKRATLKVVGARVHNLKNLSVELPRNQLVVVTGVSGSGKSSLVFDTIYAEGHRRYVESLSSYARQFLSRLDKPDVDLIEGLSPAIAIEQRVASGNPRSTVGTVTEVLDYLRLLFARVGRTYSPVSGQEVTSHSVTDVVEHLQALPGGSRAFLLTDLPALPPGRTLLEELEITLQKGFTRLWDQHQAADVEDVLAGRQALTSPQLTLLIDRFVINPNDLEADEAVRHRMADSVQTAFREGQGTCRVWVQDGPETAFSDRFEADGIVFEHPSVALFNFNNSYGACLTCEGFGRVMGYDAELVIPDPTRSVFDGAVAPWRGPTLSAYQREFIAQAEPRGFPVHRPYAELTQAQKDLLWQGNAQTVGIHDFFKEVEAQAHKVQYRVLAARYRGYTVCPECHGSRLRKEAHYIRLGRYNLPQLQDLTIDALLKALTTLDLSEHDARLAHRLLQEILSRLNYLQQVGLGYLSMARKVNTLSGGESQRIHLATSLGSNLTGSLYILDEPSVGLHPRDGDRLALVLERLRDLGNSVVVVEHDEGLMRRADYLIDIGPAAGELGGHLVHAGPPAALGALPGSLTADYLTGRQQIDIPVVRRKPHGFIHLTGVTMHNLQGVDASIPTGVLTVVTGVSGSGKSTLIRHVLVPALLRQLGVGADKPGDYRELRLEPAGAVRRVEWVDQQAVGKNLRSNPVTYVGAYDSIRDLMASQPAAQERHLKALHFSFNVTGGRCDTCQGEGQLTIPMQFLPDVKLVCDTCHGQRFKQMVLEVTYGGLNIHQMLSLTVTEALVHFQPSAQASKAKGRAKAADANPTDRLLTKIQTRLQLLADVGLGYLRLGQSTSTLSGGEAQRLKLASFLERQDEPTLYVFDEPTTGLHFHDVKLLLGVFQRLVNLGHTVLVIEHHLDVIKTADWLLDLGPEGGVGGGRLLYSGPPEGLLTVTESYTARYLAPKLARGD